MGKFEAVFPTDRRYSDNHLWASALEEEENVWRIGLTSYSVRLLKDVYFLDWLIDENSQVEHKREIGQIESSKAVSGLYAPADGVVLRFNEDTLDDPSAINADNYKDGWLFDMKTDDEFLSPQEYESLLQGHWDHAQKHLKGQVNRDS